jgi:hypothetical protein
MRGVQEAGHYPRQLDIFLPLPSHGSLVQPKPTLIWLGERGPDTPIVYTLLLLAFWREPQTPQP